MAERLFPSKRFPLGHDVLVERLERTAIVLTRTGKHDDAMKLLDRAREMDERLHPPGRPARDRRMLAGILLDLGTVHLAKGEIDQALSYCRRSLAGEEQQYPRAFFPIGHVNLATALHNLGMVLESRGDVAEAMASYSRALTMRQELASEFISSASEAEALNFTRDLSTIRDCMISLSLRLPRQEVEVFDPVWNGRACVIRGQQRRHQAILLGSDPKAREIGSQLAAVRLRISQLPYLGAASGMKNAQELKELTQRKEELERRLASQVRVPTPQPRQASSKWADLARALPPHSVYIDFVYYGRHTHSAAAVASGQFSYCAFLLYPGSPTPRLIDLGPAGPIHETVNQWRTEIASERPGTASDTMRKLIWEPIESSFPAGSTRVWIALDGSLSVVPWAAIAGRAPGSVLIEDYSVAFVPHGPFLLEQLSAERRSSPNPGGLLVVADVDYDQPGPKVKLPTFLTSSSAGRGTQGLRWPFLPGTRVEVATVCKMAGSRPIVRLDGSQAGLARTVIELTQARTAHIATHGFFADPRDHSILGIEASNFVHGFDRASPGARNPLLLSGLILAGANRAVPDQKVGVPVEDAGILTAEAIAGLPLRDLDLVVLSACETGLGTVTYGEGVFGLQRAFHMAGAQNVVASLWKVDDLATAALMTIFYDRLWRQGKPPIEALREAQLALYHQPELVEKLAKAHGTADLDRVLRGGPDFDKLVQLPKAGSGSAGSSLRHAPVRQWAAFVLSGLGR
jgi:CHAT domain-containing protein